ncbi:MAG: hypothetical protein ACI89X_003919 [Planctomycetota bacterium]|jgi:hypothetical protein
MLSDVNLGWGWAFKLPIHGFAFLENRYGILLTES